MIQLVEQDCTCKDNVLWVVTIELRERYRNRGTILACRAEIAKPQKS